MPLAISVIRKYVPALSSVDTLLSFQRSLGGSRNPAGGGPLGVAWCRALLEKAVMGDANGRRRREALLEEATGLLRPARALTDRTDAMADGRVDVAKRPLRWNVVMSVIVNSICRRLIGSESASTT